MLKYCEKRSKTPFYIEALGINVNSVEEINYFIYNHINLVYREFFDSKLFDYIRNELRLRKMADGLEELDRKGAKTQEMVTFILSESGYYDTNAISRISGLISQIDDLTKEERLTLEADGLFKAGRLGSALKIYQDLLTDMKEDESKKAFYARIAFSAGVVYARRFMCRNANSYFAYAYDLYPEVTYAKACVYMAIIAGDDEELLKTIIRYKISDEALDAIRRRVEGMKREIEREPAMDAFEESIKNFGECENVIANWRQGYYNILS